MIKDHLPEYWLHPDISEYAATVVNVSANKFTLKDPYPFFIEGGGQPDDRVTVQIPDLPNPLSVKPLSLTELSVKLPKSFVPKTPFSIKLSLDSAFRQAVMRAHTCQHLLSALLLSEHDFKTVKAVMTDDQGQLVLDKPFSLDLIPSISTRMSRLILFEPVPVSSHVLEAGSNQDQNGQVVDLSKIRGAVPQGAPFIRVLAIGQGIDLNTCGGTHVSSTDKILSFFITAVKKTEIHFICGLKANSWLSDLNQQVIEASLTHNQPFDKILTYSTDQLLSIQKEVLTASKNTIIILRSFYHSLYERASKIFQDSGSVSLASSEIKDTVEWSVFSQKTELIFIISSPFDKKSDSDAVKVFSEFSIPTIVFVYTASNTLLILVNQPEKCSFSAKELAEKCKKQFAGKGGGNEFFAQVLVNEKSFALIEEFLKSLFL